MSEMECPYCGETVPEPEECYKEEEVYEAECDECGKKFVFTVSYTKNYWPDEAPCLNGEPHSWVERHGHPEYAFVGRYRCKWCDCDHLNKDEQREGWQRIYAAMKDDDWEKPYIARFLGIEPPPANEKEEK